MMNAMNDRDTHKCCKNDQQIQLTKNAIKNRC